MYNMQVSQIRGLGAAGFNSLYCPNVTRTCVSKSVKDESRQRCQDGTKWTTNKDCGVAPSAEITDLDKGHFTPCTVANDIPVCGEDGDEDFVDENTMYIVGGILGVIVLGGIGYAVFRNKKKKKGKR